MAGARNFHDGLIALTCRERQMRLLASLTGISATLAWATRVTMPDDVRRPGGHPSPSG